MFGMKSIEPLTKFLIKALTKGIKAGNKIIETYKGASAKIDKLKIIIATMEDALHKVEYLNKEDDTEE